MAPQAKYVDSLSDVYFLKAAQVARNADYDPDVSYRVFCRKGGVAALRPALTVLRDLNDLSNTPSSPTHLSVTALRDGAEFDDGDTLMIIRGRFSKIVAWETIYLQMIGLPVYCATQARKLCQIAEGKLVFDFSARHMMGPCSTLLSAYGACVGGMRGTSTNLGATVFNYPYSMDGLRDLLRGWNDIDEHYTGGIGTMPHALFALFHGSYSVALKHYMQSFPFDNNVSVLIDYNNRELDDTLISHRVLGARLGSVRIDTCGEVVSQSATYKRDDLARVQPGVSMEAVTGLCQFMHDRNISAKIIVSSGFGIDKTAQFMQIIPHAFDMIGTGSFVPQFGFATADIFEVDNDKECKVGREWGYRANEKFWARSNDLVTLENFEKE